MLKHCLSIFIYFKRKSDPKPPLPYTIGLEVERFEFSDEIPGVRIEEIRRRFRRADRHEYFVDLVQHLEEETSYRLEEVIQLGNM